MDKDRAEIEMKETKSKKLQYAVFQNPIKSYMEKKKESSSSESTFSKKISPNYDYKKFLEIKNCFYLFIEKFQAQATTV